MNIFDECEYVPLLCSVELVPVGRVSTSYVSDDKM